MLASTMYVPEAAGGLSSSPASLLAAAQRRLSEESGAGNGGTAALERYAGRIDALLQQQFAAAGPPARPVAVVATGGYGRRHLCLHSDIDLLVVFDGAIGADEERVLKNFLNPLWDLDITLGHQVRELADFTHLEVDNPEFLLALVDGRLLAGDAEVFERLGAIFHVPRTHARILDALLGLIDRRHAQFNNTPYQLEPDVKESPGALRDLMAVRTIARLTDPSLPAGGPVEVARIDEAEDFLFRIRSILHVEAGRNQNVLTHDLQEKTAERLGYPGAQPRQRVERLMGDYFRHARTVVRCLHWVRKSAPTPVGVNLGRIQATVGFIDHMRAVREPASWLRAFQAAMDHDCEVADQTLVTIQQHAAQHPPEHFFPSPEDGAAFVAFLKPRPGLYARLSELHDCGLLGRLLPEFGAISGRVIRDFYHKYTVDEHTLLTVRSLGRLASAPNRERFAALLQDLEHPELLVLALLLHDVGKWRDGDHAVESATMAAQAMARLQLPAEARETVEFLVRHHLRMSLVAFQRDTEDPGIVKEFAALVGLEDRLKALCLMTLADVEAVSAETLTPWKEELLWRLYVDTYNQLTLRYGDELIDQHEAGVADLVAGRPADISAAEITQFVQGLPRRYLQLATPEAIYQHVRLSRDIGRDAVHLSLERRGALWELTVITLDKPYLFSNICGVLSSYGMNIFRGHAMTNPRGLVLDIVRFTDQERYLEMNADGQERLFDVLSRAVSGRSDVTARIERREQSVLHRRGLPHVEPVVHFDNASSQRFTILEISANDSKGLLYRISRVISENGCDVDLVLIATEGHKAIDVFHLTKQGAKLSDAVQLALRNDLQRVLEATDEAGEGNRAAEQG